MNKLILGNFLTQANKDFPIDAELFESLQNNTLMAHVFGNIAGDKTILAGCELEQNNTRRTSGYVFLKSTKFPNGEILLWEGGSIANGMYIQTEALSVEAQGFEYPNAYTVRYLAAGIGVENYSWSDFKRIKTNVQLEADTNNQNNTIAQLAPPPLGLVYSWAGNVTAQTIPVNYKPCDGSQLAAAEFPALYEVIGRLHTPGHVASGYFCLPDLRSRFVVGYNSVDNDYAAIARVGGEKQHTLSQSEMPVHSHGQNLWKEGNGNWRSGGDSSSPNSTSIHNATVPFSQTSTTGNGFPHENRPPFYTLAYIMRVK